MKTIVCGLLLLILATVTTTAQKESTMGGLVLAIREVTPSGVVKVEIDNSSKKPIRVWDEANMWGASHWRVLLIRNGRLETFFENPDQQFDLALRMRSP
jgi:hypothetical protein